MRKAKNTLQVYTVTICERSEKIKYETVRASSLEEAQEIAEDEFASDFRSDGMGSSYGVEVLTVEAE
jgi:hypothetical protein